MTNTFNIGDWVIFDPPPGHTSFYDKYIGVPHQITAMVPKGFDFFVKLNNESCGTVCCYFKHIKDAITLFGLNVGDVIPNDILTKWIQQKKREVGTFIYGPHISGGDTHISEFCIVCNTPCMKVSNASVDSFVAIAGFKEFWENESKTKKMPRLLNHYKAFEKKVIARSKGDDADVLSQQNYKKAVSAFNLQIRTLESEILDLEYTLKHNEEHYTHVLYPTTPIENEYFYISKIKTANDQVDETREVLRKAKDSLEYFKHVLHTFE